MLKRGRKAQVTLFVIAGLLLLLLVVLVLYLLKRESLEVEESKIESVPEEFKQVQLYVTNCIHDAGIKGILELGAHGGYIEPLNNAMNQKRLRYLPGQPTLSDLVSVGGGEDSLVPYYIHVPGESGYYNFNVESAAPEVEDMEYQLARYIERETDQCISAFDSESSDGYRVSASQARLARVKLNSENIEIAYNRQINATKDNKAISLQNYYTTITFPFLKYYDMALELASSAYSTQFSETYTLGLIGYYSGVHPAKLPPLAEYSDEQYVVSWALPKVRLDMDSLLISYTPAIQVIGAKDYSVIEDDGSVETAFLKSLSINPFNKPEKGSSINFYYPPGSLSLKVQPIKAGLIRPSIRFEEGSTHVPAERSNLYQFHYDAAYPLIVEIRGQEPNSEIAHFSFLFALESNLIENKPALMWELGLGTAEWDESFLNTTLELTNDDLFAQTGEQLDFTSKSSMKSLFCKEETWISGSNSINVFDSTGNPLPGANIVYSCGDANSCFVGISRLDPASSVAVWSSKLPICEGGYLSVSKDGFGSKKLQLSTIEGLDQRLSDASLEKIRTLRAKAEKRLIEKNIVRDMGWKWTSQGESLGIAESLNSGFEQAIITIRQVGSDVANPLSNTLVFGKEGFQEQEISLVPGTYEARGVLIDHNGLIIPKECARLCGASCLMSEKKYPEEQVVIDPVPWGGIELTQDNFATFTITASDLDNSKEIIFTLLKLPDLAKTQPPGGCIEHLDEMSMIPQYSSKYYSQIKPFFKQ